MVIIAISLKSVYDDRLYRLINLSKPIASIEYQKWNTRKTDDYLMVNKYVFDIIDKPTTIPTNLRTNLFENIVLHLVDAIRLELSETGKNDGEITIIYYTDGYDIETLGSPDDLMINGVNARIIDSKMEDLDIKNTHYIIDYDGMKVIEKLVSENSDKLPSVFTNVIVPKNIGLDDDGYRDLHLSLLHLIDVSFVDIKYFNRRD